MSLHALVLERTDWPIHTRFPCMQAARFRHDCGLMAGTPTAAYCARRQCIQVRDGRRLWAVPKVLERCRRASRPLTAAAPDARRTLHGNAGSSSVRGGDRQRSAGPVCREGQPDHWELRQRRSRFDQPIEGLELPSRVQSPPGAQRTTVVIIRAEQGDRTMHRGVKVSLGLLIWERPPPRPSAQVAVRSRKVNQQW